MNSLKVTTVHNHGKITERIQARISFTDDKINRLVYELYNLTEEEIRIVEGV